MPLHDRPDDPEDSQTLQIGPGARVLWRGGDALQWESSSRAVVLQGVQRDTLPAILDGGAPAAAQVRRALHELGLLWRPQAAIGAARASLPGTTGVAWADRVAGADAGPGAAVDGALPERLLPDLGAMSVRRGDEATEVLRARRTRTVRVLGADRLATPVAALLAAAGVGRVDVPVDGDVRLWQTMPGGLGAEDEGRRWRDAAAAALRRAAPESTAAWGAQEQDPDLVVLTGSRPVDDAVRARLHDGAIPHLVIGVDSVRAVIGPLVVPGLTSCLRCADLHRLDRDPAWWALAAQLATAPARSEPTDVALCTVAVGLAALQALAFLDGESPSALEGTLEMALPDWRLRRRSWPPHDDCDCRSEAC